MRRPTILLALLLPVSALAGGLFGDSGLTPNDVRALLDRDISEQWQQALERADMSKSSDVLKNFDGKLASAVADPMPKLEAYEAIQGAKSNSQLRLEAELEKALGVPVSNICLTPAGSCEVAYTTKGSSCYCGAQSSSLQIGVTQ